MTGIGVMFSPRQMVCVCVFEASEISSFTVSLTVMVMVSVLLYEAQLLVLAAVMIYSYTPAASGRPLTVSVPSGDVITRSAASGVFKDMAALL